MVSKEKIKQSIIETANEICQSDFMNYPDYDSDDPITDLPGALTIIVARENEEDTAELYDFFVSIIK